VTEVIINGVVLDAAVIPHRQRALLPSHPTGEVDPATVFEEKIEDRRSFPMVKFFNSNGVDLVNEE
jgi:hypothetical protein